VTIGVTADESNHIFRSQTRTVDGAIREAIRKEFVENWLKREIRHLGSSALLQKMATEILKKDLGSSKGWRNLSACLGSYQFQEAQQCGTLGARFNPSPSIFDEGVDCRGLDIDDGQSPLVEPETEIGDLDQL